MFHPVLSETHQGRNLKYTKLLDVLFVSSHSSSCCLLFVFDIMGEISDRIKNSTQTLKKAVNNKICCPFYVDFF